MYIRV